MVVRALLALCVCLRVGRDDALTLPTSTSTTRARTTHSLAPAGPWAVSRHVAFLSPQQPQRSEQGKGQRRRRRELVIVSGGFGAAPAPKKKTFVTAGKKDLEQQWEHFFRFAAKDDADATTQASVWARAPGVSDWLLVGFVAGRDASISPVDAFAVQKALVVWCAATQHLRLGAAKDAVEFGLGPPLDEAFVSAYDPNLSGAVDGIEPVGKAKARKTLKAADVGFKPHKSPLTEHQTSLGASLLNKSTSKGSVKFKKLKSSSTEELATTALGGGGEGA